MIIRRFTLLIFRLQFYSSGVVGSHPGIVAVAAVSVGCAGSGGASESLAPERTEDGDARTDIYDVDFNTVLQSISCANTIEIA